MQISTERLIITAFNKENYKKVSETYAVGNHIVKYLENLKEDPTLLG